MTDDPIPVLEVGGSHVSAAVVDPSNWQVTQYERRALDGAATAVDILTRFVAAADTLDTGPGLRWGVAMPDPFDYATGKALFRDVGKFDALRGVDIGRALRAQIRHRPADVVFVNDADAFVLGEWTRGAAEGYARCVGLTLGTGLGSGWIVDGRITTDEPGVPELGRARTLAVDGQGLEEIVSTRGIRRAFVAAGGDTELDVAQIAGLARNGDPIATGALGSVFDAFGRGISPALREFRAEVVVLGGSIARSWAVYDPAFRRGLDWPDAPPIVLADYPDEAPLRGAARATRG